MEQTKLRKKVIVVPLFAIDELMVKFGASRVGVYNALAYRSNSPRAQEIRRAAVENYMGSVNYKIQYV